MKIVGITGRSGCGKSSVTDYLVKQGYPCIDADKVARAVLEPGSPCLTSLTEYFGGDIVDENGALRRRLLADRAFATPEGTRALTEITQPEILHRINTWLEIVEKNGDKLAFIDGAVIVGTPFESKCNEILLITAPYSVSVQRIHERDGITTEMAHRRLDAQPPLEILRAASTKEIVNDGTLEELQIKVSAYLRELQGKMDA